MDLLGSIMSSMDAPPRTSTDEERKKLKEHKLQMQKWKQAEDKRILEFKRKMKTVIEEFMKNPDKEKVKLDPMSNTDRALVREMSDDAGLISFSFGQEEVDRHVIIWKKEFAPSDDEIAVLRRGEEWTNEKAVAIKSKRKAMEADKTRNNSKKIAVTAAPKTDYHTKYNHLINVDVGKDAAKDVTANRQYGNVRIENKQDRRTIEETLADRRAKKMKTESHSEQTTSNAEANL